MAAIEGGYGMGRSQAASLQAKVFLMESSDRNRERKAANKKVGVNAHFF